MENLHYAWAGVLASGAQSKSYAEELDQLLVNSLGPHASALASKVSAAAPTAAASLARDYRGDVAAWRHVASAGHAITVDAQNHAATATLDAAINAFTDAWTAAEARWNTDVIGIWSEAGEAAVPTVDPKCAPTDKTACGTR